MSSAVPTRLAAAPRSFVFTIHPRRGSDPRSTSSWTRRQKLEILSEYDHGRWYRSGYTTAGRHDTDTRPLAELEAHRSHRSPSFTSGVRASPTQLGLSCFFIFIDSSIVRRTHHLSEPTHLCTCRLRPLHCGYVSRARRHTGTIIPSLLISFRFRPRTFQSSGLYTTPRRVATGLAFVY